MPWFEYHALTSGGTAMTGRLEAIDRERAIRDLAEMKLEVRELEVATPPRPSAASISAEDLIFFNEQLASLADAGIALDEGLAQLARDVDSKRLRKWISALAEDVRSGIPLEDAVAKREAGLPILYSQVIRAGIQTGELPATLMNLNHHLRFTGASRRILWETASYPLVVMVFAIAIMSFFFIVLVPNLGNIYEGFDTQLPAVTVLIINISQHYPLLLTLFLTGIAVLLVGWRLLRLTSGGRTFCASVASVIPVWGRIHRASLLARFLRNVSTSVATGIPLPAALRLGAGATGHDLLMRDAERMASEVERGESVFVANQSARMIPPLFGFCVQTAAGRDVLPQAIDKLASSYESRALHTQSMLRTLLFPVMIIGLGGVLGLCIIAMFLPLVTVIKCMTG